MFRTLNGQASIQLDEIVLPSSSSIQFADHVNPVTGAQESGINLKDVEGVSELAASVTDTVVTVEGHTASITHFSTLLADTSVDATGALTLAHPSVSVTNGFQAGALAYTSGGTRKDVETELQGLDTRVVTLETGVAGLVASVTDHSARLTAAEGDIKTLKGSAATLAADVTALQGVDATLAADITALEGSAASFTADITTLQGVDTTLAADITTLQGVDTTLAASVTDLDTRVVTLEGATGAELGDYYKRDQVDVFVQGLDSRANGLETRSTSIQSSVDDLEDRTKDLSIDKLTGLLNVDNTTQFLNGFIAQGDCGFVNTLRLGSSCFYTDLNGNSRSLNNHLDAVQADAAALETKTGGFTRDAATATMTLNDTLEVTINNSSTYENVYPDFNGGTVTAFHTLFGADYTRNEENTFFSNGTDAGGAYVSKRIILPPHVNPKSLANTLASLHDHSNLNTRLTIMFNLRPNGLKDNGGNRANEFVFGMPSGDLSLRAFQKRTFNTMRLLGEEIYLGRAPGTFMEITEAGGSPENTEIPLRATLLDYKARITAAEAAQAVHEAMRLNLNSTIDERVLSHTTTIDGFSVGSLVLSNLIAHGLATDYALQGDFDGGLVVNRGEGILGHFTGRYHSTQGTWGLFVFGHHDGGGTNHLKMVGQYHDTADPTLPFKDHHIPCFSSEFLFPPGLTGTSALYRDFIVKCYLAQHDRNFIKKTAANPNKPGVTEIVAFREGGAISPTRGGYGIFNVVSSIARQGVTHDVETLTAVIGADATAGTVKGRIHTLEGGVLTVDGRVDALQESTTATSNALDGKLTALEAALGDDAKPASTTGRVALLEGSVGDDATTGTVKGRIKTLETTSLLATPSTNDGQTFKVDEISIKRTVSGVDDYYPALTSQDFEQLIVQNTDPSAGKVGANTVLVTGAEFFLPASPNPVVYVDAQGKLGSANLSMPRFADQVYGTTNRGRDGDPSDNNQQRFQHGLVPTYSETILGERVGSTTTVLTSAGTWRPLNEVFVDISHSSFVAVSEHLPDFQPVTHDNRFAMSSLVNGGTIHYQEVDTSFIPEHSSRLYHTPARVNTLIDTRLGDGSIANAVMNTLQAQTVTAVSDRRLKMAIQDLETPLEGLRPVEFRYHNAPEDRRYGFIAQEVRETHPELVLEHQGALSVKYLDIIALLVQQNARLEARIQKLEHKLKMGK